MAEKAFAEGSSPPPLDEIARQSGFSRATVYRYFSHRQELASAVAAQGLKLLAGGLAGNCDSFREVLRMTLLTQASMRPLIRIMRTLPEREQQRYLRKMLALLTPAFRRAQAAGEIRPGFDPDDFPVIMRMLDAALDAPPPSGISRRRQTDQLIEILLDGLFTH